MSEAAPVDVGAITLGAVLAAAIAVPAAVVGNGVVDDDSAGVVAFGAMALAGFLIGGFVAGARAHRAGPVHGAAAAGLAVVATQAIVAIVRLVGDDDVSLASLLVNALLAASLGLAGGWLADRRVAAASAP